MAKAKTPAKKANPVKKSASAKMPTKMATKKPAKKLAVKAKPAAKSAVKATSKPAIKPAVKKAAPKKIVNKPAAKSAASSKPSMAKAPAVKAITITTKDKKPDSFFKSYLKPLDDRIVVMVIEAEKMTPGGLHIPESVTDQASNHEGRVMAIGRGHMNKKGKVKPLDVSVGDKVVFSVFSGSHVDVDGSSIMVIRESDLLGIVK